MTFAKTDELQKREKEPAIIKRTKSPIEPLEPARLPFSTLCHEAEKACPLTPTANPFIINAAEQFNAGRKAVSDEKQQDHFLIYNNNGRGNVHCRRLRSARGGAGCHRYRKDNNNEY